MNTSFRALVIALLIPLAACGTSEQPAQPSFMADGKISIINYWAIWCAPCREEIPELNELAEDLQEEVSVYAVNFDGVLGEELKRQAAELGIEFALLEQDPARLLDYPRPTVLPTTLIIEADGNIKARLLGPQTADAIKEAIEAT